VLGVAIALAGCVLSVGASASYGARVRRERPFLGGGRGRPSPGDDGANLARAVEALGRSGCDTAGISGALRGQGSVRGALLEVDEALGEIDFRISARRAAAAGGVRLALTAGLLGGVLELLGGTSEEWLSAFAAITAGLLGAALGWELLRRADESARAARLEWDGVAGTLERALRGLPPCGGGRELEA